VLNLSPNHLDWHGTLAAYAAAKRNILRFQRPGDFALLCADDAAVRAWGEATPARTYAFSLEAELAEGAFVRAREVVVRLDGREEILPLAAFRPVGPHNALNAAAAALAARLTGGTPAGVADALERFEGLPHRLELVAAVGGVRYYDDSVATTPESAVVALRSFPRPVIILGGYDKGVPYDGLGREAAERAKAVVLMGAAADRIAAAIPSTSGGAPVHRVRDLAEAVRVAQGLAEPGDVVLLSPGCASYDMFGNYEHRAEVFRSLVAGLGG